MKGHLKMTRIPLSLPRSSSLTSFYLISFLFSILLYLSPYFSLLSHHFFPLSILFSINVPPNTILKPLLPLSPTSPPANPQALQKQPVKPTAPKISAALNLHPPPPPPQPSRSKQPYPSPPILQKQTIKPPRSLQPQTCTPPLPPPEANSLAPKLATA